MQAQPGTDKSTESGQVAHAWALIPVILLLAFLPALSAGFVDWDDGAFLYENPMTERLDLRHLAMAFTRFEAGYYAPLVFAGYTLERAVWGLNATGYHAVNLCLHCISALLAFVLLRKLGLRGAFAFLCVLVWAVHPLRAESVAWVTERKDCLSMPFLLAALILYLEHAETGRRNRLVGAWICQLLSLMAKGTAVVLPLLLMLLDWRRGERSPKRLLVSKAPFLALSVVFGAVTFWAQATGGAVKAESIRGPSAYLLTIAYAAVFHFVKNLLPVGLSAVYSLPSPLALANPDSLVAIAALAAAVLLAVRYRRRAPGLAFGLAFWVIAMLPVSQLIPLPYPLADRYTYLPALGLSFGVFSHLQTVCRRRRKMQNPLFAVCLVLIAVLVLLTHQRCYAWRSSWSLWRDAVAKQPRHPVALNNLGRLYVLEGYEEEGLRYYLRSLSIQPRNAMLLFNVGNYYHRRGDYANALDYYRRAVKEQPTSKRCFLLGSSLEHMGRHKEALEAYRRAESLLGATPGADEPEELQEDIRKAIERCSAPPG